MPQHTSSEKKKNKDVAAEIRRLATVAIKNKPKKPKKKVKKNRTFGEAIADALDIFKVGKTVKKAADK